MAYTSIQAEIDNLLDSSVLENNRPTYCAIQSKSIGSIWFIGKEVATALGYADTAQAVRTHCRGVVDFTTPSISGNQVYKIIPESDVYRLAH